ncbi:MAG TPA: S41 family peptidase [Anaerolineales bacterium]|nr:S41 family peptidase [Anaerolineales bacterium]
MKKRKLFLGFLILTLLSCNYVTQMIVPPTATPIPTATVTPTITASPTASPVPLVPAFIPPQCASTPFATVAPDAIVEPTPESDANPEISSGEQLRILSELGNIVEEVYVYPDFNGKDWREIESRYKTMIEAGLDTETFYLEMQNMIGELEDEHSFFLSPLDVERSEAELRGENNYVGIGVYGDPNPERGNMVVISTFPGSAAEHAGIQAHDSLLQADGMPIIDENFNRLRGPECSAVIVTVQSPGEAPRDVMLIRHSLQGNLQIESQLVPTTDGSRIGYLFIPTFFDETIPPQIETALNEFGQLDGLILDVRMNGGGSSNVANPIMGYFASGRLGQFVSRFESRPLSVEANPIQNSQTVPLVVLVSEDTVSYGEIFAGIMRDSRDAKISGETSLGNVEVLNRYQFEDGSQVWLATETFFPAHSDENWEETGIVPDIQAFADWETFTFETDPSIAAALSLLGHK